MKRPLLLVCCLLLIGLPLLTQPAPVTKDQVLKVLSLVRLDKSSDPVKAQERVASPVRQRGVNFELTPEVEAELKDAGALDDLLTAIRLNYRPPAPPPPPPPSYEDLLRRALESIRAQDAEGAIRTLQEAARVNPAGAEAHEQLGSLHLLHSRNSAAAVQSFLSALQNGGSAQFRVLIAPEGENFQARCEGTLRVQATNVEWQSAVCRIQARLGRDNLLGVHANRYLGAHLHAFGILARYADQRRTVYNLAPRSGDETEAKTIIGLLEQLRVRP